MSEAFPRVKLVTIVAAFETRDRVTAMLRSLGVPGFTTIRANGTGLHGPRRYGVLDGANVRIDSLVSAEVARQILERVRKEFEGDAVLAYTIDAQTIAREDLV